MNRMQKYFFMLLSLCCLWLPESLVAQERYDSYFNGVTGSSRVIGFGGAYHGLSDGIEAGFFNPAGLSTMVALPTHVLGAEKWDFPLAWPLGNFHVKNAQISLLRMMPTNPLCVV